MTDRPPAGLSSGPPLPWELAVPGVPASLQSKGKRRPGWRSVVTAAATSGWPGPPLTGPAALTMVFFHLGEPVDVDNMLKPTIDALVGIVLADDVLLDDVCGVRRDLRAPLVLRRPSPTLAAALATYGAAGQAFVYLPVHDPRNLEELLR
jgi:crossover junction endodeoxyribonuclease RusA